MYHNSSMCVFFFFTEIGENCSLYYEEPVGKCLFPRGCVLVEANLEKSQGI